MLIFSVCQGIRKPVAYSLESSLNQWLVVLQIFPYIIFYLLLENLVFFANREELWKSDMHACTYTHIFWLLVWFLFVPTTFAWLKCKEGIEDSESFLREFKIIGRSGSRFGYDPKYVRISLLGRDKEFDDFLERLSVIKWTITTDHGNWTLYSIFILFLFKIRRSCMLISLSHVGSWELRQPPFT